MNKVFTTNGCTNHSLGERQPHDFYATDPQGAYDILELKPAIHNIWEPCCGAGHLAKVFAEKDVLGKATDLNNYGYGTSGVDFLKETQQWDGWIVTNPPYKYAMEFVQHSLKIAKEGTAMLLKLTFLESIKRYNLFTTTPPNKLYIYSKRLNCAKNGDFEEYYNGAIAYAWYVWDNSNTPPTLHWIKP